MNNQKPVLFGKFLSPYVRRVAVTMNLIGMAFEHRIISAIEDETEREAVNPVGRVPALRLPSGETLIDSAAILDHLDEVAGPDRVLIPQRGAERRNALQILAIGTGAIDRAMTANAERRRSSPDDARQARLLRQCQHGFAALETALSGRTSFDNKSLMQTDVTIAIGYYFVNHIFPGTLEATNFPGLANLSSRCEAMPEFAAANYQ